VPLPTPGQCGGPWAAGRGPWAVGDEDRDRCELMVPARLKIATAVR